MSTDPRTLADVMVTGLVAWAAVTVTAGIAVITARTVGYRRRQRNARGGR